MIKIQNHFVDENAEQALRNLFERAISETETHRNIDMMISKQINTLSDVTSDLLIRYYKLSRDPAYQRRLIAYLREALPSMGPENIQQIPQALAYHLAVIATGKISNEANAAIYSGIEGAVSDGNLIGLQKALCNAKMVAQQLCDEFFIFDSDGLKRVIEIPIAQSDYWVTLGTDESGGVDAELEFLSDLSNAIRNGTFFDELLTAVDKHNSNRDLQRSFEELRDEFGAKGANLTLLQEAANFLGPYVGRFGEVITVPNFQLLSVSVYEKFKNNLAGSDDVTKGFQSISGREVILRSSAQFSEDGEHMGAGVYASYRLPANPDFDRFCAALKSIFDSVDSEFAQRYRQDMGVMSTENMGVIIQDFISPETNSFSGRIDTVRAQIPALCNVTAELRTIPAYVLNAGDENEIVDEGQTAIPLKRASLYQSFVAGRRAASTAAVLERDHTKKSLDFEVAANLAKIGILLEIYFKKPLQIEYVACNNKIHLVQARPLPPNWTAAASVTFPEEPFIWQGKSCGVIDRVLKVLPDSEENCRSEGLLILSGSAYASNDSNWLESRLPKSGAVWLLKQSGNSSAHVESRCLEREVVVITGEMVASNGDQLREKFYGHLRAAYGDDKINSVIRSRQPIVLTPSQEINQLRVVSTGLEARIYPLDQEFDSVQ